MSEPRRLLELIERFVVEHGGDLGGWTRLDPDDDALQLFDGRVTLRARVEDNVLSIIGPVHAHVLTQLHEYDDEVLDACLIGLGAGAEHGALEEAAVLWVTGVAGPIRSFLDGRPVCMTCRAGVAAGDPASAEAPGDYGLPGLRAFVGPAFARGVEDERVRSALDDTRPWFRFAAEAAAPRRVHLAKAVVLSRGKDGWSRELEVDGHEVSHSEPDWPAGVRGPDFGYLTRFAVFEFPPGSPELARRAEVDRTIRHFATNFARHADVDPLMDEMVAQGFDPDLVKEAESIATIAFGRMVFESRGVAYSPHIIRARRDGRVEVDVPLMSIPTYPRARALFWELRAALPPEEFQALCLYNAESAAIVQAFEAHGEKLDLSKTTMHPCVVPDRDVDPAAMDAALAMLHGSMGRARAARTKPWWKFW